MIYSLTGEIVAVDQNGFAIQTGGVAFFCFSTMNTLQKVGMKGSKATVFTYMNVREDAIELTVFTARVNWMLSSSLSPFQVSVRKRHLQSFR